MPALNTNGKLNYLAPDVASSLFRNGEVLIRRNTQGSDSGAKGVTIDAHTMPIRDARALSNGDAPTVTRNGFELIASPLVDTDLDFLNHETVVRDYYPHCVAAVETATGARAYAFDHNVRSASGKETKKQIDGGQEVQGPAHVVHGDYTLTSGPQRLRDLTQPPAINDTYKFMLADGDSLVDTATAHQALSKHGRFAIINVWRNIAAEPVATHPMAFCDGQSVEPDDLVVFEIHYTDRIGENYFAKHMDRHQWSYFPHVTRDEAILIKQWDSAGPLAASNGDRSDASDPAAPCSFSFHSAFEDPNTPENAPDRWSIEVRCLVIY